MAYWISSINSCYALQIARIPVYTLIAISIIGCTPFSPRSPFTVVTINELRADPSAWTGKAVEVTGILIRGAGPMSPPSSLSENCSGDAHAVLVRWDNVPGLRNEDTGAKVKVRGVFRMGARVGSPGPPGRAGSTNSAGAGTLENVSILWRLPADLARCHLD